MKKALIAGFKAFFEVEEDETLVTTKVAKRVSLLTLSRVIYNWTDWAVAGALASFSFWMQANQFSTTGIYLGTFLYDFFAAAGFFFLSDMTGCDFTLGRSFRRVSDSFKENGFWGLFFSALLLLGLTVKGIIWEGPEVICVLFKKELKRRENIWLALFVLSAIQGVFGTWLYTTGYNLWQKLVPPELNSDYVLLGIATFIIFIAIVAILKKIVQLGVQFVRLFLKATGWQQWSFLLCAAAFIFSSVKLLLELIR